MKYIKCRSVLIILIATLLFAAFIPMSFASAKTKKMKAYQIIKTKTAVFCCDGFYIYRYNLKTKKVKRLTSMYYAGEVGGEIKIYNGYLYYVSKSNGTDMTINRIRKNGKSRKTLANPLDGYNWAVSGSRLYYDDTYYYDNGHYKTVWYSVKLSGKNRKKTSTKCRLIAKKTNKKGYKIVVKRKNFDPFEGKGYMISYLKKPNGKKIKLGKVLGKDYEL